MIYELPSFTILQAIKGKKLLDNYLDQENFVGLAYLLRYHDEEPGSISDDETWDRDYIDYYVEYFSLLSIATLINYNNENLPEDLKQEAQYYLNDKIINKYYSRNYVLLLPQLLQLHIERKVPVTDYTRSALNFHKFLHLNNLLKNNEVDDFLWLLDGGVKGEKEIDIDDFNNILSNPTKFSKVSKQKSNSTEIKLVNGYLQYLQFIYQFDLFLKELKPEKEQSAYWHYHRYWFTKTKDTMSKSIHSFFSGLEKLTVTKGKQNKILMYLTSVRKMKYQYQKALNSVCNDKYGKELKKYVLDLSQSTK